jgi:hypothetical protein
VKERGLAVHRAQEAVALGRVAEIGGTLAPTDRRARPKQPSNEATQAAQATTQAMSASQKCTLATVVPRVFHRIRRLSMSFAAPGARHRRCLRVLST